MATMQEMTKETIKNILKDDGRNMHFENISKLDAVLRDIAKNIDLRMYFVKVMEEALEVEKVNLRTRQGKQVYRYQYGVGDQYMQGTYNEIKGRLEPFYLAYVEKAAGMMVPKSEIMSRGYWFREMVNSALILEVNTIG